MLLLHTNYILFEKFTQIINYSLNRVVIYYHAMKQTGIHTRSVIPEQFTVHLHSNQVQLVVIKHYLVSC